MVNRKDGRPWIPSCIAQLIGKKLRISILFIALPKIYLEASRCHFLNHLHLPQITTLRYENKAFSYLFGDIGILWSHCPNSVPIKISKNRHYLTDQNNKPFYTMRIPVGAYRSSHKKGNRIFRLGFSYTRLNKTCVLSFVGFIVVKQNANCRRVYVVVLPILQRPKKGSQKNKRH